MNELNLDKEKREFFNCLYKVSHNCGVRFIIIDDFQPKNNWNSNIFEDLKKDNDCIKTCNIYEYVDNDIWRDINNQKIEFVNANKMDSRSVYKFISVYREFETKNEIKNVSYEDIGFGIQRSEEDPSFISIPVGLINGNKDQVWGLEFSDKVVGGLIIGNTGTGKSSVLHTIIMNGAMKYSPDELIFQCVDFKANTEASYYASEDCLAIPHMKSILKGNVVSEDGKVNNSAIITDADILFDKLSVETLERQKKMNINKKMQSSNIMDYNKKCVQNNIKKMPRLVVIIDECHYLFANREL